jgi:sec-independent protein translocase protein TatA
MPGFGSVGIWETILILAVLLLVFGARRLPEIGGALGKGIREFKDSLKEVGDETRHELESPDERERVGGEGRAGDGGG